MPDLRSKYVWSEQAGRYRSRSTGRFVARSTVTDALQVAIDNGADAMRQVSEQLREGTLSLAQWQTTMMEEIKMAHLNSVALAKGGWDQLTPADTGRAGGIIAREYRFLSDFAGQIASGEQPLDGRFLNRAKQYIKAGRETYIRQERSELAKMGFDEERSIRHANDSCEGCIREEDRGWVTIGQLIPPGNRECRSNCLCTPEYRNSITQEVRAA